MKNYQIDDAATTGLDVPEAVKLRCPSGSLICRKGCSSVGTGLPVMQRVDERRCGCGVRAEGRQRLSELRKAARDRTWSASIADPGVGCAAWSPRVEEGDDPCGTEDLHSSVVATARAYCKTRAAAILRNIATRCTNG